MEDKAAMDMHPEETELMGWRTNFKVSSACVFVLGLDWQVQVA